MKTTKKIIALALALLTLLGLLAGCGNAKTTSEQLPTSVTVEPTGETQTGEPTEAPTETQTTTPTPTVTPTPVVPPTPTETPEVELPSSSTLVGTKHLPIVDNQGSIGSCTSEGVTFTQFTVAVSQYMSHHYPDIEWDPSSGNPEYIFSPKFTYNYSTGSTEMCYKVLMGDGCLPLSVSCFGKYSADHDPGFFAGSNYSDIKTRAWEVGEGQMIDALKYRLLNFQEYNCSQLCISGSTDNQMLRRVKEALVAGNAVAVCGSSSYWTYTTITEAGDLAKRGENVMWCSRKRTVNPGDGGGHCVAIIGYDDNAVVEIGGVRMKGAFLVRNSWGNWMNAGNVWMMYDACDADSIYAPLNSNAFNSNATTLNVKNKRFVSAVSSKDNLIQTFLPAGEAEVNGVTYPTYYICDTALGCYLTYSPDGALAESGRKSTKHCEFVLLPYADTVASPDAAYKNSYVLYAVNVDNEFHYLSTTNAVNANAMLTDIVEDPANVCMILCGKSSVAGDGSFTAMITTAYTGAYTYTRESAMYSYSFIYWDKDIAVGAPKLSVEANIEAIDRSVIYMTLTRTDKNGVTETFVPGMMENRIDDGAQPDIGTSGKRTSFSGVIDPTKRETGWMGFGYLPFTAFDDNYDIDNFVWGVTVKGSNLTVKEIRLVDENGSVLRSVKPDDGMELLAKGETQHFAFDMGAEKKVFFGAGSYKLKNVKTGKILSLSSNNMTFAYDSGKPADAEKAAFRIRYDEASGCYYVWNHKDTYVWDISGTTVGEGVKCQLNAKRDVRKTQTWKIVQDDEGRIKITLAADEAYSFGDLGSDFGISANNDSDAFLWELVPASPIDMPITVDGFDADGNLLLNVIKPLAYKSGTVGIKIVKDGKVVSVKDVTPTNEGVVLAVKLESGSYLFTALIDGKPAGMQIAYEVKLPA